MFFRKLQIFITGVTSEFAEIEFERRQALRRLAHLVEDRLESEGSVAMTFICTHNSRRSHLAQVWMDTAARYFGISGLTTYSGGTEATAFNLNAVAALQRAGFHIGSVTQGQNPKYAIRATDGADPMIAFSKVYDHPTNPSQGFVAVMNCAEADADCPIVPGASNRFALPYQDPKIADGTSQESTVYDLCCRRICRELCYLAYRLKGSS